MIYELRHYIVVPGQGQAILNRFKNHTFKIFDRRGFKVQDFWVEANSSGHLWYVLEWQSAEQMEAEWTKFLGDEEWQSVKADCYCAIALSSSRETGPRCNSGTTANPQSANTFLAL